jgi:catalase
MVSHLLNVDNQLAEQVGKGRGLQELPKRGEPAKPTRTDLQPSPAFSILRNGPKKFEGRKVGALVTDGIDSDLVTALSTALDKESATLEFIAPTIAGVRASDDSWIEANQKKAKGALLCSTTRS